MSIQPTKTVTQTITVASSEHTLAIPSGYTTVKMYNQSKSVIQWSFKQNSSGTMPNTLGAGHNFTITISGAVNIYWQTPKIGDVLLVDLT